MSIDDLVKAADAYKSIDNCLYHLEGHDEFDDICEALELAKSIMLSEGSEWQVGYLQEMNDDDDYEQMVNEVEQ